MKIFRALILFIMILIYQNFLEAIIFQLYRLINGGISSLSYFDLVFRYFFYKVFLTIIPYSVLMMLIWHFSLSSYIPLIIIALVLNISIAAFIGMVIESSTMFDTDILIFSLFCSLFTFFLLYILKFPRNFLKNK